MNESVEPPQPHIVSMGSGLPVVAIHGNGVDHRLWLSLHDALAEAGGLERWYVDLPGFGSTPALAGPSRGSRTHRTGRPTRHIASHIA